MSKYKLLEIKYLVSFFPKGNFKTIKSTLKLFHVLNITKLEDCPVILPVRQI